MNIYFILLLEVVLSLYVCRSLDLHTLTFWSNEFTYEVSESGDFFSFSPGATGVVLYQFKKYSKGHEYEYFIH